MLLKAVIFDVDGTLAETEEFNRCAFNAAFAEHGIDAAWSISEYRGLLRVTGGKERLAAYFAAKGQVLSAGKIIALHQAKNSFYARALRSGSVQLRAGVRRLIAQAQSAGIALGIATTTSPENLDALLRELLAEDWQRQFACVVAGDAVARKKPAADVYHACVTGLGIQPSEAIAIEDSAAGVASAHGAGVAVLATPSMYTDEDDFSDAELTVPGLGEPDMPWERDVAGVARRWIELEDLQRIVARRTLQAAGAVTP